MPNVTDMPVLSAEDITALLAGRRNRGGHDRFVAAFVATGEMYAVVNAHPDYKGKTVEQLGTSVKQGLLAACKRTEGAAGFKCILTEDEQLLLINPGIVADTLDTDADAS